MATENRTGIAAALNILKKEEPEACDKVQLVMSDMAKCFFNAWTDIMGGKGARRQLVLIMQLDKLQQEMLLARTHNSIHFLIGSSDSAGAACCSSTRVMNACDVPPNS